jgi:peptide/nickel transport system substrate-binding protein
MWMAIALAVLGYGGGGPPGGASGDPSGKRPAVKRIAIGITTEPDLHPTAGAPHHRFQPLVHSGLSVSDDRGALQPALAEALPTLENGLWKLLPDGRMETTWRLRPGAQWHDGTPFTADDLRFTLEVGQDPGVAGFQNANFRSIEAVATPDAHTLTLSWSAPFVAADRLFGADRASRPLPRHRLGDVFQNNKPGFADVPFWTQEYVGAGPYRIREWAPGVTLMLEAHSGYALGRPRIDEIEVRIIPDGTTIMGNLLSGAVDFVHTVGLERGIQLRDQWRAGTVIFQLGGGAWVVVYPQFLDPGPRWWPTCGSGAPWCTPWIG